MRFNSTLIYSFLLVSAVLANPGLEHRDAPAPVHPTIHYSDSETGVMLKLGDNTTYLAIADIVVPNVTSVRSYANASVWLSIDDDSCGHSLRVGIFMEVIEGQPTYTAFYQHYPGTQIWKNVTIIPLDVVRLAVTVPVPDQPMVGYVMLGEPHRNGTGFIEGVTSPKVPFCRRSAKWILENPTGVPWVNFGLLTFANAMAYGANMDGSSYVLTGDDVTVTDVDGGATVVYPPGNNSFTITESLEL